MVGLEQIVEAYNRLHSSAIQKFGKMGWVKRIEVNGDFKTIGITEANGFVFLSIYPLCKPEETFVSSKKSMETLLILNSKDPLIKYAVDEEGILFLSIELYMKNFDEKLMEKAINTMVNHLIASNAKLEKILVS